MDEKADIQFYQLVLSLQAGAMQQLGKIVSPMTGQVERDLMMARNTIDLLEMFQRKTKGNLSQDESSLLDHVLYELRLNYVDELEKDKAAPQQAPADSATSAGSEPPSSTNPEAEQ